MHLGTSRPHTPYLRYMQSTDPINARLATLQYIDCNARTLIGAGVAADGKRQM